MRLIVASMLLAVAGPLAAQQPLTLREALQRATSAAYPNRVAAAQARAAGAGQLAALRGVLPTVRFEAGYVRTTDPIGAFGTTLRQRAIESADFDPQRLNFPRAAGNYAGAVVVEAPLLNADAHIGRSAAVSAGKAAHAAAAWTAGNTRVEVISAYFGAVLSAEKTRTLESALRAAQAHVRQAEVLLMAGMATRSDALLAEVKAGELETQLIQARGDERIAAQGLSILLGGRAGAPIQLPDVLPDAANVRRILEHEVASGLESRSDVIAARESSRAARLDVARASSLYLPRLNAIGRYDWNSASKLYGGDNNWTVGIMASWTPFAGGWELAERRAASARANGASAGLEAALAQAELDASKAQIRRQVALSHLEIAQRSAQQSAEAHRIVARKYAGGLATIVELLEAAAIETQTLLAHSHARYSALVAAATDLLVRGADPAIIAELLPDETIAGVPHEGR